jgi:hypothetical protein
MKGGCGLSCIAGSVVLQAKCESTDLVYSKAHHLSSGTFHPLCR